MSPGVQRVVKYIFGVVIFFSTWLLFGVLFGFGWGLLIAVIITGAYSTSLSVKEVRIRHISIIGTQTEEELTEPVKRQIGEIIKAVESKNIDVLVTDIYREIRFFPKHIHDPHKERYIPSMVEKVIGEALNETYVDSGDIEIKLPGAKFHFRKETNGLIKLLVKNILVFSMNTYDRVLFVFKDGPWVDDLRKLKEEIEKLEKIREEKKAIRINEEMSENLRRHFKL